jgi:cysteine-rich repeat protein
VSAQQREEQRQMTRLGFSLRRWLGHRLAVLAPGAVLLALATAAGCSSTSNATGASDGTSSSASTGSGGAGGVSATGSTGSTGSGGSGGMATTTSTTAASTTAASTTAASSTSSSAGTGGAGTGGLGGAGGMGPVYVPPAGSPDYPAEVEPNNLVSMANALHAGTKGFTAALYPLGDVDVFSFQVVVPGTSVSVATSDGMNGCPAGAHTLVRILDAGNEVIASDDGSSGCASFTVSNTPALLDLAVGTYYVHVESSSLATLAFYILDIRVQTPSCGDGTVQVGIGEQCDHGSSNGGATDGCSATCQLKSGNFFTEVEPNDTQATGNDIDTYVGAVGQIEPVGDVDFYTVSVTVPGSSIIAQIGDGFGGCPSGFESILQLLDASGMVLASNEGGGVSPCSAIDPSKYPGAANLPVGTYWLQVQSSTSAAQLYYVLSYKVSPPGCGDGIVQPPEQCDPVTPNPGCSATCMLAGDYIPETELNDSPALANPIGTHAGFLGSINPVGDLDYFSFDVPGPSSLVYLQTSDGLGGCPADCDTILRLYGPSGTQIVLDDNGGVSPCSLISPVDHPQAMNLAAGTYKARVEISGGNSLCQLYVLSIAVKQPGCGDGIIETGEQCDDSSANGTAGDGCSATCQAVPPWEVEPNNTRATATPPWSGFSTWKGAITPLADHDYYSFTVPTGGGMVTLTTHDVDAPTVCTADTVLYLLSSTGAQLATDDDHGPGPGDGGGKCSKISMTLAAGTYYTWVQRFDDLKTIASYQLDLLIQ